ncbi:MarR family winged helix-turn-helix transcriptional regulator [Salinibacterium soli]|uniref:MarR family transcriptional regulator n=1 Tax=Antiquaquibacter soli TaxID=3064523 RepID=A0ABT9BPW1_9MICO|nr:MarR family transcriptional regulator [Protaetiibacter sp. WY-16]MDO7883068.1 MarR family transcriptional regulator [Protaetiibacter sp. WY-16]
MSDSRQADAVRQIEEALLALRPGPGRGGPFPGAPWGERRPPWGDGPPPWAGGHGPGHPGHPGARMHGRGMHGGARIRLLEVLAAASPDARLGISEVADAIGVDQPRASRLVADAASRGLVSREVDPRDARKSVLAITQAGRSLLDQIRSGRRSAVTDALAGFSEEEAAQLAELLTRFVAAWKP